MIEIHSHVLFGLDDGAPDLEHSLQMVQDYVQQGVTEIICTPHFEPVHYQDQDRLTAYFKQRQIAFEILNLEINQRHLPIQLHLGAEIMMAADIVRLFSVDQYKERLKLAGSDYILIEMPRTLTGGYQVLDQMLFRLQVSGLIPILAHPERSMSNPEFLDALQTWVDDERLLVQVNASSFVLDERLPIEKQQHYRRRETYIWELARRNLIHFVASDAHHPAKRPVQQKLAKQALSLKLGPDMAERLTHTNPAKIIANQPI
jgi:protein-tyrosine phosphatase